MQQELRIVWLHLTGHGAQMKLKVEASDGPIGALPAQSWNPDVTFHHQAQEMAQSWFTTVPRLIALHPQIESQDHNIIVYQPFLIWTKREPDTSYEMVPLRSVNQMAPGHGAVLLDGLSRFWTAMPNGDHGLPTGSAFGGALKSNESAVFFGGTFNPWHPGHSACLDAYSGPDILVVIPDRNPFKPIVSHDCPWAHYRHISAAAHEYNALVYPGFLSMQHANPTAHWIGATKLKRRTLLLGEDSFEHLPHWIRFEALIKNLNGIFVVPRQGHPKRWDDVSSLIHQINPELKIQRGRHHPFETLSSTEMRSQKAP